MEYPPKVLINRTGKTVEFMCGGQINIFEPGETKPLEGFVAYHALNEVNTGLEELTPEIAEEEAKRAKVVMPDYSQLPWKKLVSKAGKDFKPGMMKTDVLELLENRWRKRNKKWLSTQKNSNATKASSSKKSSEG